jgi:hypothetical protein
MWVTHAYSNVGGKMPKKITYGWHTVDMVVVTIPVTKKHNIKLYIKEEWADDSKGIYPPSLDICIGDKPVTDAYIKRTPDLTIAPTGPNLAEHRMAERRTNANENATDEN